MAVPFQGIHHIYANQKALKGLKKGKFAATGGWGFEGFGGNSKTERLVEGGGKDCFDCHASEKAKDYVFSEYRD